MMRSTHTFVCIVLLNTHNSRYFAVQNDCIIRVREGHINESDKENYKNEKTLKQFHVSESLNPIVSSVRSKRMLSVRLSILEMYHRKNRMIPYILDTIYHK